MNKNLKALHEEARNYAMQKVNASGYYEGKDYLQVVAEKFAQLIIEKCIDINDNIEIYEHFGLK